MIVNLSEDTDNDLCFIKDTINGDYLFCLI
jgi:hypothetical protein